VRDEAKLLRISANVDAAAAAFRDEPLTGGFKSVAGTAGQDREELGGGVERRGEDGFVPWRDELGRSVVDWNVLTGSNLLPCRVAANEKTRSW
jgi:hypothetical protein